MAAVRSIFEYVSNKCYNGLYDAAKKYLDNHWHTMGLETRRVAEIKNAEESVNAMKIAMKNMKKFISSYEIGINIK